MVFSSSQCRIYKVFKALTVVTTAGFSTIEIRQVCKKRMKNMFSQKPETATLYPTDATKVLTPLDTVNKSDLNKLAKMTFEDRESVSTHNIN